MKLKYTLSIVLVLIVINPLFAQKKNKLPEANRAIANEARFKLNSKVGKDWKFVGALLKNIGATLGDKSFIASVKPGDICVTNGYKQFIQTDQRDYWVTVSPMVAIVYKIIDDKKFQLISVNDDNIAITSEWDFSKIELEGGKYYIKFLRPERGVHDMKSLKLKAPK